MTTLGASPWLPKIVVSRSPCSTLVGWPVLGPPRWTFTTTSGISAMTAYPNASCIREKPGPEVAVITSLSLEHTAILGSTIPQIAFEKAGIIKPGIPVVAAPNPAEALAVAAMRQHFHFRRLILVFGALQDKDVAGMLHSLLPAADEIVVARTRYPRSLSAAELVAAVRAQGREPAAALDDVPDAVAVALALAAPGDAILATGSLFVAAGARESWARLKGLPLPTGDPPMH